MALDGAKEARMTLKIAAVLTFFMSFLTSPAVAVQELDQQLFNEALYGKAEDVRVLLKNGANPNAALGDAKQTALMAAASRGNVEALQMLLAAGAAVNARDRSNISALMLAALSSSGESVELLIQSGADINATTSSGQSVLMMAALIADAKVIQNLLRAKSDVRAEDQDGWTALNWAYWSDHPEALELLRQAGASEGSVRFTPHELIIAAHDGDVATVRRLVEGGAPLNATDQAGYTPLVIAAEMGRVDVVKLLLAVGADPNITDNMRPRWLLMLVSEDVVLNGIDEVIETGRGEGITPLNSAARFGQAEVVRILLKAGAKVNAKYGRPTSLLLAVEENGHAETVRLLLEAGAEVDAQGRGGMSPLMKSSFNGDAVSVGLLLAHGADVQLRDNAGRTALAYAHDGRVNKDVVALLKQAETKRPK